MDLARGRDVAKWLGGLFIAVPILFGTRSGFACATCDCGDPTLTTIGLEKPFSGRIRASAELRVQSSSVGSPGVDEVRRVDTRLELAGAWAPIERLVTSVTVPLIHREVDYVNLGHDSTTNLGDITIRAKLFLWSEQRFAPRHLVAAVAGIKLPTAPELDAAGRPLSDDAQTGTGSFDPEVGLSYAHFRESFKFYASAVLTRPLRGWGELRAGMEFATSVIVEYQPSTSWAVLVAADSHLSAHSDRAGIEERDTGGFIGYLSPRAIWSPVVDCLLHAGISFPVVNSLSGRQDNGPLFFAGATFDF